MERAHKESPQMRRVEAAEPYRRDAMGSLGDASAMYISQGSFPDYYPAYEEVLSFDSDRLSEWDRTNTTDVLKKYKTSFLEFEHMARTANGEQALKLLSELTKISSYINELRPDYVVRGYRILGSVNRSNGYPIWHLQLYLAPKNSRTKTYSGENAPNIRRSHPYLYSK